jgi:hypothetical protein
LLKKTGRGSFPAFAFPSSTSNPTSRRPLALVAVIGLWLAYKAGKRSGRSEKASPPKTPEEAFAAGVVIALFALLFLILVLYTWIFGDL